MCEDKARLRDNSQTSAMPDRLHHVLAAGLEHRAEKRAREGALLGARERAEDDAPPAEPTAAPPAVVAPRFIAPAVQPSVRRVVRHRAGGTLWVKGLGICEIRYRWPLLL